MDGIKTTSKTYQELLRIIFEPRTLLPSDKTELFGAMMRSLFVMSWTGNYGLARVSVLFM